MKSLWNDDRGALISTEFLFITTILVLGLISGLKAVQSAVVNELEETANAIGALSQSYSFAGTSGCCARTNGSTFTDGPNVYPVSTCAAAQPGTLTSCAD